MDQRECVAWLSEIDKLSADQRAEARRVLAEQPSLEAVVCLLEERISGERRCPRCAAERPVIRGRANGLRRCFWRSCGKTFNCLTRTPLGCLRHKERWSEVGASMSKGETVAASGARCGVAGSTAFRWRHSFLRAVSGGVVKLRGIVEADETFVLASRKGERNLDSTPRKRGGQAAWRGLSDELVPPSTECCRPSAPPRSKPFFGLFLVRTPCWSPMAAPAIHLAPSRWTSVTKRSTRPLTSGCAAISAIRWSTAATCASRTFSPATVASPQNISIATCGGITSLFSPALLHPARFAPHPQEC